jgi:hypothetical protein
MRKNATKGVRQKEQSSACVGRKKGSLQLGLKKIKISSDK